MKEDIPYYRVASCCANCAHGEIRESAFSYRLCCRKYDCVVEGKMVCYDYEQIEP